MGVYDALAFVSYGLIAVSYAMRDIKWLRVITVLACSVDLVVYYFIRPGQPLWVQLSMSVLFIAINLYQLYVLWRESRGQAFDGDEGVLHREVFSLLSPAEFRRLLKLGHWRSLPAATPLLKRGEPVEHVTFVVQGHLTVQLGDVALGSVLPGEVAGEMSYLTGRPASADVRAGDQARVFQLAQSVLDGLKHKDPELHAKISYVLGRQVADKLSDANRRWADSQLTPG